MKSSFRWPACKAGVEVYPPITGYQRVEWRCSEPVTSWWTWINFWIQLVVDKPLQPPGVPSSVLRWGWGKVAVMKLTSPDVVVQCSLARFHLAEVEEYPPITGYQRGECWTPNQWFRGCALIGFGTALIAKKSLQDQVCQRVAVRFFVQVPTALRDGAQLRRAWQTGTCNQQYAYTLQRCHWDTVSNKPHHLKITISVAVNIFG